MTFFEKPLIAAVQGQAVGVGVTLLLHCDLVVAADNVRLTLPFLKLGLVPEAGSTLLLPQRIGHARAFAWMALGEAVGAEQALALGLVNRVAKRGDIDVVAGEMAARSRNGCRPARFAHTKALMRDANQLWDVGADGRRYFPPAFDQPGGHDRFRRLYEQVNKGLPGGPDTNRHIKCGDERA
ncbi:MAG: enoyl-CoA hydratase-related protein [Asticcacaulis sp.]